jgi:hypothetical protein
MTRLLISVEGKSEWKFVEQVLQPHFANLEVYIKLHNMKGNISIDRVSGKLNRLIHNYDFVTTLYDFYGFKGLSDNETEKTLEDIERLRKIFATNPNFCISDFQGIVAEDGQFYIIDPQDVDLRTGNMRNLAELSALQGFKEVILKHHERFTDKTLNHIIYIDKKLEPPAGIQFLYDNFISCAPLIFCTTIPCRVTLACRHNKFCW